MANGWVQDPSEQTGQLENQQPQVPLPTRIPVMPKLLTIFPAAEPEIIIPVVVAWAAATLEEILAGKI
jgi:hypothetical protein